MLKRKKMLKRRKKAKKKKCYKEEKNIHSTVFITSFVSLYHIFPISFYSPTRSIPSPIISPPISGSSPPLLPNPVTGPINSKSHHFPSPPIPTSYPFPIIPSINIPSPSISPSIIPPTLTSTFPYSIPPIPLPFPQWFLSQYSNFIHWILCFNILCLSLYWNTSRKIKHTGDQYSAASNCLIVGGCMIRVVCFILGNWSM